MNNNESSRCVFKRKFKMFIRREICLAILFVIVNGVFASTCPENKKKICDCKKNDWNQIVLFCQINDSSINIVYEPYRYMKITCHNAKWSDFYLRKITKRGIDGAYFYMCDLPKNRSLKKITDMLGALVVRKLVFQSHKNLVSFKRLHLKGFEDLHLLDISNNNISTVDPSLLADLPDLTTLKIRGSNIHTTSILFDQVPKLQELDLGENMLETIEPGTIDGFYNLKHLFLRKNSITKLESGTFNNLVNLQTLHLTSNNLTHLQENIFGQLINLEILELKENNFTFLPRYLLQNNTNLRIIDLASNKKKLDTLPSGFFSNLTKLEILMLEKNGLNSLPKDLLWGCLSLNYLDLSKNNLAFLHNLTFQDLGQLGELKLDSNAFEKVPNVFWNLKQLRKLDLSKNRIFSIDKEVFKHLRNLKEFNMAENFLTVIADKSFIFLEKLEIANFSHNNLTLHTTPKYDIYEIIDESPFASCYLLKDLYLDNNRIFEIFSDWVTNLESLQILDLKNNYISSLSIEYLNFVSYDIEVDLTYNKIQYIFFDNAENIFNHTWSNKVDIWIQHNPLHCGCELYNYLHYIEDRTFSNVRKYFNIDPEDVTCFTPLTMRNVNVTDLRSESFKCAAINSDASMCPDKCNCHKKLEKEEFMIDCFRKNFTVVPSVMNHPHKFWQVTLNFSDNHLTQIPNLAKLGYGSVNNLILSHNNISEISLDGLPEMLEILELHNNKISKLSSEVINFLQNATNLYTITLHNNPFICNCNTTDFFHFTHSIKKHRIVDLNMIRCQEENKLISKMTMIDFCPSQAEWINLTFWITMIIIMIIFGLLFSAFCFFFYKNKELQFINNFMFPSLLKNDEDDEESEETDVTEYEDNNVTEETSYDVFISYSQDDQDFVMNELVCKMENDVPPLKLYLPHRDWLNEWTTTNIMKYMEISRRMMMVLSPSFLENVWGKSDLRDAHYQALSRDQSNLILILYGDIESTDEHLDSKLKAYINANTYIKWGDPLFWRKLGQLLTHNFEGEADASEYNEPTVRYHKQGSVEKLFFV